MMNPKDVEREPEILVLAVGSALEDHYLEVGPEEVDKLVEFHGLDKRDSTDESFYSAQTLTNRTIGGGAVNTAINAGQYYSDRDDAEVYIVASVAEDNAGARIRRGLGSVGVKTELLQTHEGSTGKAEVLLSTDSGARFVFVNRGVSRKLNTDIILPRGTEATILHATSLGGNLDAVAKLLEQNPSFFSWDPGQGELTQNCFLDIFRDDRLKLLKANLFELAKLDSLLKPEDEEYPEVKTDDLTQVMNNVFRQKKDMTLLVTHGAHGMWFGSYKAGISHVDISKELKIKVKDELGAGDAAAVGAMLALGNSGDFDSAGVLATIFPTEVIQHYGANLRERPHLDSYPLPRLVQIEPPLRSQV